MIPDWKSKQLEELDRKHKEEYDRMIELAGKPPLHVRAIKWLLSLIVNEEKEVRRSAWLERRRRLKAQFESLVEDW